MGIFDKLFGKKERVEEKNKAKIEVSLDLGELGTLELFSIPEERRERIRQARKMLEQKVLENVGIEVGSKEFKDMIRLQTLVSSDPETAKLIQNAKETYNRVYGIKVAMDFNKDEIKSIADYRGICGSSVDALRRKFTEAYNNVETKIINLGRVALIGLLLIGVVALSGCIGEVTPTEEVPEGMPTIEALSLQNAVTLDGKISGNEWDDAGQLSLTFTYSHGEPLLACPGTIYLKHDGVNLWICIRVQDDDENKFPEMSDYAAILFDANGDGDISHEDDSATIHHGEGPEDLRPDEEGGIWRPDTEFGGSNDVAGESGWTAGWYTYEMRKPLNSGDVNGYDIAISPGDTILSCSCIWDAGEATEWSADAGSFYIKLD